MATETAEGASTDLQRFIGECHAALTEQSQGRPQRFLDLWARTDDASIMAAIGGYHVGYDAVSDLLSKAAKTQSFETWTAENLVTNVAGDLAFTVEVETYGYRTQDREGMKLRATQIYRRAENREWRIVHRHGDILVAVEAKW